MSSDCRVKNLPIQSASFDGRIGYPDIVVYEILEGPAKGVILPVPPKFDTHPKPEIKIKYAMMIKPENRQTSCAYKTIVKNQKLYDEMFAQGFWFSPTHIGKRKPFIDYRKAPGT